MAYQKAWRVEAGYCRTSPKNLQRLEWDEFYVVRRKPLYPALVHLAYLCPVPTKGSSTTLYPLNDQARYKPLSHRP